MTMPSRAAIRAVGIAAALTIAIGGCGGNETRTAPPATATSSAKTSPDPIPAAALPTVEFLQPDRHDPIAVARAFLVITYTRNTVTEPEYSASLRRAAPLMTPALAAELTRPTPGVRPLSQWVQWSNARLKVDATVRESSDEHPADTPDRLSRVFTVAEQLSTENGVPRDTQTTTTYLTLTFAAGQWLVSWVALGNT
ncbi:MAG: hypothetical protein WA988_01235 [Candidatus Nanopelagicales bacterium]|jgi:hypothetical protein